MPVEGLSCPSCGGPVSHYQEQQQVTCAYCGTGLIITRDSYGDLAAVIAGIRADTDLLNMGLEYQQLRLQLERLNSERALLYDPIRGRESATYLRTAAIPAFLLLMGLFALFVGVVVIVQGPGVLVIVSWLFILIEGMLAYCVVRSRRDAQQMEKLQARVRARSPALDEEIRAVEARMRQLETVLNSAVPSVVPVAPSAAGERQ